MKKYWHRFGLVAIVLFAFLIRVYRLGVDLPTVYGDEAGGHYQALQTLLQPSDIVHKVYYFLQNGTATLTWVFGLTPLGVRLPAAIYGTLVVLAIYFFCSSFTNKRIALVATLIAAVSPWNFMLSRIGHPHVLLMVIFVLLSMFFYLSTNLHRKLLVSLFFLGLATYEYPSMVIISPIIALLMLIRNARKNVLIPVLLFIGVAFSIFVFVYHGFSIAGRGLDLAIWRDPNVTAENNLYRGIAGESILTKIFYNYPMSVVGAFTKNYLSFFSPDFLFLRGDSILRHSTGQVGTFLPFTLPFMIYGAYKFFQKAKPKTRNYFLVWILVSPIPAAITSDGAGYLLRVVTIMPFLTYFIALGITGSFDLIKKVRIKIIYAVFLSAIALYSTGSFLYGYFKVYPTMSAKSYEVGFKDLALFQLANNDAPMLVVWHGFYPDLVFRFWQKTPFDKYDQFVPNEIKVGKSVFMQTFSNLYLGWPESSSDLNRAIRDINPEYLAIPASYIYKTTATPIQTIKYPDQNTAFLIYKITR